MSRATATESRSLSQLVEMLSSALRLGGGSLVEIYKSSDVIGHTNTLNMLGALSFIDKVATV